MRYARRSSRSEPSRASCSISGSARSATTCTSASAASRPSIFSRPTGPGADDQAAPRAQIQARHEERRLHEVAAARGVALPERTVAHARSPSAHARRVPGARRLPRQALGHELGGVQHAHAAQVRALRRPGGTAAGSPGLPLTMASTPASAISPSFGVEEAQRVVRPHQRVGAGGAAAATGARQIDDLDARAARRAARAARASPSGRCAGGTSPGRRRAAARPSSARRSRPASSVE